MSVPVILRGEYQKIIERGDTPTKITLSVADSVGFKKHGNPGNGVKLLKGVYTFNGLPVQFDAAKTEVL